MGEPNRDLKKSAQLNPYSATTLSYLAMTENILGMKASAAEHISKAFRAREVPPIVYVNRANIELNEGNLKKASADADTALKKDPWLKEGYELRARIRDKMKDSVGAEQDRHKAQSLISHLDF